MQKRIVLSPFASWESSAPLVISEEGFVMRQAKSQQVVLTGRYLFLKRYFTLSTAPVDSDVRIAEENDALNSLILENQGENEIDDALVLLSSLYSADISEFSCLEKENHVVEFAQMSEGIPVYNRYLSVSFEGNIAYIESNYLKGISVDEFKIAKKGYKRIYSLGDHENHPVPAYLIVDKNSKTIVDGLTGEIIVKEDNIISFY